MKQYLELVEDILHTGVALDDRTGTGRVSVFGKQMRFDLTKGFPIVTTKRTFFKGIIVELLWFLGGYNRVDFLHEHGVHFWDEWANETGSFGPIYGPQLRHRLGVEYYSGEEVVVDQWKDVVDSLRNNPMSRRHVLTTWNPEQLSEMALPPCHGLVIQFFTDGENLSCQMYQRSADVFLGLPFNIASYAAMTHIMGRLTGLDPKDLIITLGDAHLYSNHLEQARELLTRTPHRLPELAITKTFTCVEDLEPKDFRLIGYTCEPHIAAEVSV